MKYRLFYLVLFSCFFLFKGSSQSNKESIFLTIQKSSVDREILIFTLRNVGSNTIRTDRFDYSKINRLMIISPLKEVITHYDFVSCHPYGHVFLKPKESKVWEYNIQDRLTPFFSRKKLPKGQYEVYWIVNGVQSASFFYEKLYDGVRW